MTQAWSPMILTNVAAAGDLTELFPDFVTPGVATNNPGDLRRKTTEGVLHRVDLSPIDQFGGYFELWDVGGRPYDFAGANNINTGTAITDAYLLAEKAAGRAKQIWRIDFKGDSGLMTKTFATRVPFSHGLAGRYVNTDETAGTVEININIVAEGGYLKFGVSG